MRYNEGWETPKGILVILAHPDDPEFFLGGTIARWNKAGHSINYVLLTKGDKGTAETSINSDQISEIREKNRITLPGSLGVSAVSYMDYQDGYIVPDLEIRKKVVRVIRDIQA